MSNRHCIDKILERQHSPQNAVRRPIEISRYEDGRPEQRLYNGNILVHLPQDMSRSIVREQFCSYSPICYSRVRRCNCHECTHQPAGPWIRQSPPPMFQAPDKHRNPFTSYPCGFGHDRDYRPLGNSSLATRPKHQSSGMPLGAIRRKKRHRTAFTPTQLLGLENSFEQNQYSVGEERKQLAAFLGLSETQIKVWFQNRRTKWKRIRKEAEEEEEAEKDPDVDMNNNTHLHLEAVHSHRNSDRHEQSIYPFPYERRWSFRPPPLDRGNPY